MEKKRLHINIKITRKTFLNIKILILQINKYFTYDL